MAVDTNDTQRLGVYHISSAMQNYEVARSNFFTFIIDDNRFRDLYLDPYTKNYPVTPQEYANPNDIAGGESEIVKLSVKTITVPHFSNNPIEVRRGNSIVKFADIPNWNSGNLTIQDFVGLRVKEILMAWQALVYDPYTDIQGRAADWVDNNGEEHKGYKFDCTLAEYSPDFALIRTWKMRGCWIKSLEESNFDVEGTGGRELTAGIEFDRAELILDNSVARAKDVR